MDSDLTRIGTWIERIILSSIFIPVLGWILLPLPTRAAEVAINQTQTFEVQLSTFYTNPVPAHVQAKINEVEAQAREQLAQQQAAEAARVAAEQERITAEQRQIAEAQRVAAIEAARIAAQKAAQRKAIARAAAPAPLPVVQYGSGEMANLIISIATQFGINPNTPLCIAQKESGMNPYAKNRSSTASGLFQFIAGTWRNTNEGRAGISVFDARANATAAIRYMAVNRSTQPWEVRHMCPRVTSL